jgi:fido (protein-threonine AMPylation protein)
MPHRAGYFVLAYAWDHHCREIFDSVEGSFRHVEREVGELARDGAWETEALLNYYKKWHYNNDLFRLTMEEIRSRQNVINSLGYRGYGVNRDLSGALAGLATRYGRLAGLLAEQFSRKAGALEGRITLPRGVIDQRRSDVVIRGLAHEAGRDPEGEIPRAGREVDLDLDHYLGVMSGERWQVNTAIFQKMFFSLGVSSMTIMKGSTGLEDSRSCQELKLLANRNLAAHVLRTFSGLEGFTEIGTDLLKAIHRTLSKDLDPDAGDFRRTDFPDRNGVTFGFGNFEREIADFAIVLAETARSFHRTREFIYNLARSYYMLLGIHPFLDANGRVGRCFLNLLLVKKGLPPVALDDEEEVRALPRYGGSMEDMDRYLKGRLKRAMEAYFYERRKLESLGLLEQRIYNVSFDSGLHFRQIGDRPPKIEVGLAAYVIEEPTLLSLFAERGKIVFPEARLLYGMTAYCGIASGPFTEWRDSFSLRGGFSIREMPAERPGVRVFDVDFIVEAPGRARRGDYFSCSIVSGGGGLIFNNKGLNYSYRLDL